jgi:hypothetical protein
MFVASLPIFVAFTAFWRNFSGLHTTKNGLFATTMEPSQNQRNDVSCTGTTVLVRNQLDFINGNV